MHKLIEMKDHLTHCAYEEITEHLDEADTGELGEVIDMIKDLEEAIYYATITKAMNAGRTETAWEESGSAKKRMDYMRSKEMHHDKSVQLQELDCYLKELSKEVMEMVDDASLEEKKYLASKMQNLAAEISGNM